MYEQQCHRFNYGSYLIKEIYNKIPEDKYCFLHQKSMWQPLRDKVNQKRYLFYHGSHIRND